MRTDKEKRKNGFTLFEILVVIGLVGMVGSLVLGVFGFILKGAAKASIQKKANDNGMYVIDLISKEIRNAEAVSCLNSSLIVTRTGGSTVNFTCTVTADNQNLIKKDGGAIIESDFSAVNCDIFDCSASPDIVGINFTLVAWDSAAGTTIEKGEKGFKGEFNKKISPRKY
jgi:prepilin-type N-terminal cleavage/methylation domain-containing protein